jgi:serine protease
VQHGGLKWIVAVGVAAAASVTGVAAAAGPDVFRPLSALAGEASPERAWLSAPRRTQNGESVARVDAETLLVRFKSNIASVGRSAALQAAGARASSAVGGTGFTLVSLGDRPAGDVLRRLRADQRIAAAEHNHLRRAFTEPNDLLYAKGNQGHYLRLVRMPAAWDSAAGLPAKTVAVIDTGVDADHPDLSGRVLPGRDFANDDMNAADDNGHGTMVAGFAAATGNNGRGVAGAAWNARILPVKVLDAAGSGSDADIAAGITWAADQGADVINLSLGGPSESETLEAAVEYASGKGALVVAAAGNDGFTTPSYPAAIPDVVAVGATDWSGNVVWWSNYGPWIDIVAPGYDVSSTALAAGPVDAYEDGYGTSFSSPLVAGVAALVRAKHPTWSPGLVAAELERTARDAGPRGIDDSYGHGLLDAYAALGGAKAPPLRAPAGDPLEPNGTPDRASALTSPFFTSATISPQGEVDWFTKDVTGPATIRFQIEASWAEPYAEAMYPAAQVFGPRLEPLGPPVRGWSSNTWIEAYAATAGRYYLKVWNDAASRSRLAPATPWGYTVKNTVEAPAPASRFDPYEVVPLAAGSPYSSAVADVTGDGRDDALITLLGSRQLLVFRQRPDGYLASAEPHQLHPNHSSVNLPISTGDANGDGVKDVAVAFSSGGSVSGVDVLYGGPTIGSPVLAYEATDMGEAELADLDGDRRADLVAVSASRGVQVLRSTGSAFAAPVTVANRGGLIEIGELSGDGRNDIAACCAFVFATQTYYVDVHLQQASGGYATQTYLLGGPTPPGGMEIADVTGDGRDDLVITEPNNRPNARIAVFRQSSGTLAPPVRYEAFDTPYPVKAADVNGDGRNDLITAHNGWEQAGVFLQTASGTLAAEELYPATTSGYYYEHSLGVGDLNGDGRVDFTLADPNNGLSVFRQTSMTWPPPIWVRDTAPADSAEGAAVTVAPTIRFGRDLRPASVTGATVRLTNAETQAPVAAALSYDGPTRTVTVRPAAALASATPYRIEVSGVEDAAGAAMEQEFAFRFTVGSTPDAIPPETTITAALWGGDFRETGFDFSSSEPGSRFECSVDNGSWNACDTPLVYALLPEGSRSIRVRATDAAGNIDATPAMRSWTMPPTNDNFAAAQALAGSAGTVSGTSVMATKETGEPNHAGVPGGRSVWLRWTAPTSGPVSFDTFGSEFETVLAVYTGTGVAALTSVGANDDVAGTDWSQVVFTATAGTTYAIAVDGGPGTTVGRGTLALSWGPPGETDVTPPESNPVLTSTHPSAWSNDATVDIAWSGGSDSGSGVDGYSYEWSQSASTTPDAIKDAEETARGTTSPQLADGEWWFHLRTGDNAGNWSEAVHLGPFRIDGTAPVNPTTSSTSHTAAWSNDATVDVSWLGASDVPSGLDGYSYSWTQQAAGDPVTTKIAEENAGSATSPNLLDGEWWFHLRTLDNAGNWSSAVHVGPFLIDTAPPETLIGSFDGTTFTFVSEAKATFECSLDDTPYAACVSPTTYPGFAPGGHLFRVRALDRAGNPDPTPAELRWTVGTAPPPPPPPPSNPPPADPPTTKAPVRARPCVVPQLTGRTIRYARLLIARAGCRVGRVRTAYSTRVVKGRVISQSPLARRRVARGTRVSVVVSLGRKPAPRRR